MSTSFRGGLTIAKFAVAGPTLGGLCVEEPPVEVHGGVDVAHVQGELDAGHRSCLPVLAAPLGEADAKELAAAFRAIADPARLRLLSLIAAQPDAEACGCHLLESLGLSQPTVSHHLKLLHGAGLLTRERRGSWVYYRIVPERLAAFGTRSARRPPISRAMASDAKERGLSARGSGGAGQRAPARPHLNPAVTIVAT